MFKSKKPFLALLAILALVLAACNTSPSPGPTTTTTVAGAASETPGTPGTPGTGTQTSTGQQPAGETPPTVTQTPKPSVSESEMTNLFARGEELKAEADALALKELDAEAYGSADTQFAAAKTRYATAMSSGYDGVKAAEIKPDLAASVSAWENLIQAKGPERVELIKDASDELRFSAMKAEAGELAAERFAKAEETRAEAGVKYEEKDYVAAAEGYRKAGELYELSEKKATANKLRQEIFSNGYAKYSESFFQMGEDQYEREEVIWAYQGPIEEGKKSLDRANEYYGFVAKAGAEYKSFEGKDKAQAAREAALAEKADLNASESFASAEDIMAEALANQGKGSYESAYLWFMDASGAYGAALDESLERKGEAEAAIERAEAAVGESAKKAEAVDLGDNVYLEEAKASLGKAKDQYEEKAYIDSAVNANEALNFATMSDNKVADELAARQKAAEEEAKRIEAEKAAADPAMADARTRMAWAENNEIKKDYPAEYKQASTSMQAADLAYANGRYVPAKGLAEDVSATLSDGFQAKVLADRKAIEEAAAKKAAEKAEAETAMEDAQARMAWANENKIVEDYASEYQTASGAMKESFNAYGKESYPLATEKAKVVSSTLSDDFKAKVEAERKAAADEAARIEAEKAAADPAMADARTRMAWAENNEIK
ncbi:MAG TPA: hypothetical protein VIO60_09140, partial [Rectinemataceae bacterium]